MPKSEIRKNQKDLLPPVKDVYTNTIIHCLTGQRCVCQIQGPLSYFLKMLLLTEVTYLPTIYLQNTASTV